ncbi:MAG: oxidoreductase [Actinophytocola sp.]|nr:oxidoreductase [Actinophytocola sp.]
MRHEVKAADLVQQLTEPGSGGLWRRRTQATSPTFPVTGRYITGVLDLRGADLDFLLRFDRCRFENQPDVREAQLLGLAFLGCWLPGLKARNLRCQNDVRLFRSRVHLDPSRTEEPQTSLAMQTGREPGKPDAAIVLTDAVVQGSVVLSRSEIEYEKGKAIQADRLSVSGALLAYRLATVGQVRLPGLRTGGNVNFSGSRLHNPRGIALNLTGAHISGSLLCENESGRRDQQDQPQRFSAEGVLFVPGARIDGDLVLRGAKLRVRPGGAVRNAAWRDAMRSGDPSVDPWPAIVGDRMRLDGNLACGDGFSSDGTLRLVNAVIGGSVRLANGEIKVARREQPAPQYDRALHLDGSEISGDVQAAGLVTEGQLRLSDVRIGGNLLARYATFGHAERDVLSARRSHVAGNVQIADSTLTGTLQLQGMEVGGAIELFGTSLTEPALRSTRSYSVDLRAVRVGRDLVFTSNGEKPFWAAGGVNLDGARVGRRVNFVGALLGSIDPPRVGIEGRHGEDVVRGIALDASDVVADEILLTPQAPPHGMVILRRAHCATLDDNVHLWRASGGLELDDFRYDALRTPIDLKSDDVVDHRVALLRAAMRGYRPGPYDQLAGMLRASGNEEHASTVLLRKQQYRYEALSKGAGLMGPAVRVWSSLQRAVVGYGYRPMRALGWLLVLLVAGSLYFGLMPDACVNHPEIYTVNGSRCVVNADDTGLEWNPILHTADLLVPIVDFGNKGRWHMGGADKWVATGFTAAGWILATTVAAGLTRMLRRP